MTKQRQRPIKFRAWDKKEKRMCPVVYALFPYTYWGKKGFWIDAGYYRRPQDGGLLHLDTGLVGKRFELMQFTGLHDKNGKEIYRGDIVKRPHGGRNGEVIWFNKGAYWGVSVGDGDWEYGFDCNEPENHEVIGNIYENPELLEPKEK